MTVTVLWGPPLSGKSSYIRDRARTGDVVIDMDRIVAAMTVDAPSHFEMPQPMREPVFNARRAAVDAVFKEAASPDLTAWVIDSGADDARLSEWEAAGADVVRLVMSREDALAEAQRVRPQSVPQVIAWYAKHGPDLVGAYDVSDLRFNPNQPRDADGKWGSGGGGGEQIGPERSLSLIAETVGIGDPDKTSYGISEQVNKADDFSTNDRAEAKELVAKSVADRMTSSTEDMVAEAEAGRVRDIDDYTNQPMPIDERDAITAQPDDTQWENVLLVCSSSDDAGAVEVQVAMNLLSPSDRIVADVATRADLMRHVDADGVLHDPISGWPSRARGDLEWAVAGTPAAQRKARESMVSSLVDQWAITSNDSSARSHAIQEAARDEFGLSGASEWDPIDGNVSKAMAKGREIYAAHGAVYRDFVRAQYDGTQEWFKERDVVSVELWRGVKASSTEGPGLAPLTGKARTRPLSSWAYESLAAESFAGDNGVLMRAVVPASRILSQGTTGVGCLSEAEMVVLGGEIDVHAKTTADWWGNK
jgi:hypothetical protein